MLNRQTLTGIGLAIIHVAALAALLPQFFSWSALIVLLVTYNVIGMVGVTLCYHRSLTHRGFALWKPLEYVAATLGTLALQGGPIEWVSTHRKHHAHTDTDGDPHSAKESFWWAHMEWLYRSNEAMLGPDEVLRYAPDLAADRYYQFLDKYAVLAQVAFGVLLFALGGWSWVVWGVFVRLVLCYHATWLVNSAAHTFGYRSYKTTDLSTNNWWVALLSWGEGWHNNHHAFPFSARHGLRWFEFDPTWAVVKLLTFVKLARDVKIPSSAMLERLKIATGTGHRKTA